MIGVLHRPATGLRTIGIPGAGRVGAAEGRQASKAGNEAMIATSKPAPGPRLPAMINESMELFVTEQRPSCAAKPREHLTSDRRYGTSPPKNASPAAAVAQDAPPRNGARSLRSQLWSRHEDAVILAE
jgi:hypothetical protein